MTDFKKRSFFLAFPRFAFVFSLPAAREFFLAEERGRAVRADRSRIDGELRQVIRNEPTLFLAKIN